MEEGEDIVRDLFFEYLMEDLEYANEDDPEWFSSNGTRKNGVIERSHEIWGIQMMIDWLIDHPDYHGYECFKGIEDHLYSLIHESKDSRFRKVFIDAISKLYIIWEEVIEYGAEDSCVSYSGGDASTEG